jgi:hypothetical protein
VSGLIARLIAAGTPADLIEEVAMLVAQSRLDKEAIESRRRADRDRQASRRNVTSRDITGDSVTSHDVTDAPPSLDKETSPRPPKEINPNPERGVRAQGARLPAGWKPGKLDRSTVSGQIVELRGQDWARCALESFENHWRSANGPNARKRDWQATWANWVIEQDRRDGKGGFNGKRPANDHRNEPQNAMFRVGLAEFGTG